MPKNPFIISGYEGKEYFCDREQETLNLQDALYNERNVVLISPRRMGKTGLIHHLFASIPSSEAYCIYADIYKTENLNDFIESLGRAIIGQCGSPSAREKVMQMIQSLRFSFSTDAITGQPEIGVHLASPQPELSLTQIFTYMEKADKPVYLAIDEFQRILDYPEKNIEEILRTYIQTLHNVHFIFSGSQKHMMIDIFCSAKRAFYQSAQMMQLDVIDETAYFTFCQHHLQQHSQRLNADDFHFLYHSLFRHTWYIQSVMNRLYASQIEQITRTDIQQTINKLVQENQFVYQNYCGLLAPNQLRVLRAIAKEGEITEPSAQEFISKYKLSASSTVRSALRVLIDKEFVYEQEGRYSVYDRFFGLWLVSSM